MTAYSVIACDVEIPGFGLCMSEDSQIGSPKSATEARRRLAREGWHRTAAGRDVCPDCWEAGRR